jgi:subtilisin family serine protease
VRPERYLVAASGTADGQSVAGQLGQDPEIAILRTIGSARPASGYPPIAVIETTAMHAAVLASRPDLYVESDQPLGWRDPPEPGPGMITASAVAPAGEIQRVSVVVKDDGGRPVPDAAVWVLGRGIPGTGFTGADGRADLPVAIETAADVTEVVARPARGCWPARLSRPAMQPGQPAEVSCERITTTFPDFPEHAQVSWGALAMGFDRLPPTHRGHGIRIAVVDSGAASGHPDLTGRLTSGTDVVGRDRKGWQEDPVGTGTHQAVLIAGRDDGSGVVGLAPEAEMHIVRVAPGGHCADLIEALDFCIDQDIDVALISAGCSGDSPLLASKVLQARARGVACIAPVGDSSGPIGCPASLPAVLAVSAIGRLGTFPADSGLAAQLTGLPTADGFFAPRFSNYGPGVDCCGPGVAIVSGLPRGSYGPMSGTATAAAHVAAVAALVLAHHPQFAATPGSASAVRDARRVDGLFQVLVSACRPLPDLGPLRVGAGLPDAAVAVGVAPWGDFARLHGYLSSNGALAGAGPADDDRTLTPLAAAMRSAGLISEQGLASTRRAY